MPHALIENSVVIQLDLTGHPPQGYVECPGEVQPGYTYLDGEFAPPVIIPAYQPPVPQLSCVATLDYSDFDISGVENGAGMSVALVIDTGKFWLFFETPMENIAYPWNVSSSIGKANVTDRQLDYIEITVTDDAGASVAAASVSVQIFRVS